MGSNRATSARRRRRNAEIQLSHKGDGLTHRQLTRWYQQYALVVTRKSDSEADAQRRRRDLAAWFTRAVEAKEALGWSRTRIAMKAGLNRKDLYRWLDPEEIPKSPRSATIRRICDGLNLDYSEPARIMGWDLLESGPSGGAPTALEGKIARARALLRTNLSPAQRAEYEKMLAGYERVYERMLDDFFEQIEADIAQSRESEREQ